MVTRAQLEKAFKENGFKETRVVCPDGAEAWVTPCSYATEITSTSQCDYFLVESDIPWLGGEKLEKVIADLNNHEELLKELNEERDRCKAFFDEHQAKGWDGESWSWYSDWHKDLFGYRPHARVFGEYIRPW